MKFRYQNRRLFSLLMTILLSLWLVVPISAATYTYDDVGRLTSVTTTGGSSCAYSYDTGGNILTAVSQSSPLSMVVSTPVDQATNVPIDQTISIQFNKNIEQDTNFSNISLMAGQTPVSINNSISNDTLSIDPVADLTQNTAYALTIPAGAVKAVSGTQSNSEIIIGFTTVAGVINLSSSDPVNNATSIPVGQTITLTFDQNIQAGDNYANITLTAGGIPVAITNSIATTTLSVDPNADLSTATQYTLTVPAGALKSMDSTALNSEVVIQFTTA